MSGRWVLRRKVRLVVATAVGLLSPLAGALVTPAQAATVSCPGANLQTEIDAAPPGSTISLSGTCTGQFVINKSLQLVGPATLDGANGGTVVTVGSGATVRFDSLTIQHGRGGSGGVSNQGSLALYNTTVRENNAVSTFPLVEGNPLDCPPHCTADGGINAVQGVGGGVLNTGSLTLNGSTVTQNSASGSFSVNQFNSLTCSATCTVTQRNFAIANAGGGIFNDGGRVALNASTVSGNSTVSSGDVTQTNSANCTASCTGTQSNVLISGAGGGIFNHQGSLSVNDSTVSGNSSSESSVTTVQNNTGNCGCLQIDTISTFGGGAGIFNDGKASIIGSTLANNTGDVGGGILNASGATAAVLRSMIVDNSAHTGGGVYNEGTFSIQASTVSRNHATVGGGGVLNVGAFTHATSTISGNTPDDCVGC